MVSCGGKRKKMYIRREIRWAKKINGKLLLYHEEKAIAKKGQQLGEIRLAGVSEGMKSK